MFDPTLGRTVLLISTPWGGYCRCVGMTWLTSDGISVSDGGLKPQAVNVISGLAYTDHFSSISVWIIYTVYLRVKGEIFKTSFGDPNSGFTHYMRHTFGMMKIFIFSTSVVLLIVVRNLEFCILFINRVVVWKD